MTARPAPTDALVAAGFPKANIIVAPQAKTDTENAFNAANIALTKNPQFKHWVAFALNDEGVLGAVRAAEGRGFKADNMIGVGIGGSDSALNEFKKPNPTGFFGTVIISPKRHGEETSELMYDWIKDGKEPPQLTLTTGMLATRDNVAEVREQMGLASASKFSTSGEDRPRCVRLSGGLEELRRRCVSDAAF